MNKLHISCLLLLAAAAQTAAGQSLTLSSDDGKAAHLLTAQDTVEVRYASGFNTVAVAANQTGYEVTKKTADADWVSFRKEKNGNLTFFATYNEDTQAPRYATFTLSSSDGAVLNTLVVKQLPNTSAAELSDYKWPIKSATATSTNSSSEDITKTYDDDASTIWHSSYSGGGFPITLTYTLAAPSHVDYLLYTPRTSGTNGNFGEIKVQYASSASVSTWVDVTTYDCGMSGSPTRIPFGAEGIDDVQKVKIIINSGSGNFASCAEMGFYERDESITQAMTQFFADSLCTTLKDGADASKISNPFLRTLGKTIQAGNYSTEFRVGEFGCYEDRGTLRNRLKVSNGYDPYENPTGIYFSKGEHIVVFAEGISDDYPVSLCIKNFSNADDIEAEGQPESYYGLVNGANIITASNRGNGYINYYSANYQQAPKIKLHFALAQENGYYDASRHNNEDWKRMLANVKSDIFDVLTQRLHVAAAVASLKRRCPENGEKLALIYDSVIYREREIMGLPQMNKEPKNHQFARPVRSGMFADGTGAAAAFGSFDEWANPDNFGFWGFGHELGHINQITPGFKWSGLGETTNNIYSAWVEHKVGAAAAFGTGYHRLEDERSGIDSYNGMRGGRFEAYLEEGVRKGVSWQLQDGPDYHGTEPTIAEVTGQDENGNSIGTVSTETRNYDHFLKVVPLWQLALFTEECGYPVTYGNVIESYRSDFNANTYNTGGKQQIEFIRRFCEKAQLNLCDFFEKAGMLKPINHYIEDYSPNWLIITQDMCDRLRSDIEAKGYEKAPAALNYINAYNYKRFRDKVKLTAGTAGEGCSMSGSSLLKVDNDVWAGAVGYETYNIKGELMHITMFGLGDDQMSSRYTYVLFPAGAKYVKAVGYDGTSVEIYRR